MSEDYLIHYGKQGMKWGVRRSDKHTQKLAKKDAKKYADAKMYYGEGAGTRRKLLKAELNKKKRTIPGYEDHFNKYVESVDFARSATKAKVERKTRDSAHRTKVVTKKILKVTAPITMAAGSAAYLANKERVDNFVIKSFNTILNKIKI